MIQQLTHRRSAAESETNASDERCHPVRYSPCTTTVHHHYRYLSYAYRISGPIASSKPCTWAELRDLRPSPLPFTCGDPWSIVISEKEFR
jgi:hypothetical protein